MYKIIIVLIIFFSFIQGNENLLIDSLSLREKIAQMIMVRVRGDFYNTQNWYRKKLKKWIHEDGIGGVITFGGSVHGTYYNNKMFDTLQSVKNHKKNNWLKNISKADLTYLVNFKLIEVLTKKYNLKVNKLTSQREFLINLGILNRAEIISKNLIFSKKADIYYRLNRLINKSEMGELFKVMFVLNKKIKFNTGFVDD